MSTLFNEHEADAFVNKILSKIRRNYKMQFIKTDDGSIAQVTSFEVISRDDLQSCIDEAQVSLDDAIAALSDYDKLNAPEPVAAPIEPTPAPEPVAAPTPEPAPVTLVEPSPVQIPIQ